MYNLKEKPFGDVNCTGLSEPTAPELFGVPSPAHVILPESDSVSSCLVLNTTPEGLKYWQMLFPATVFAVQETPRFSCSTELPITRSWCSFVTCHPDRMEAEGLLLVQVLHLRCVYGAGRFRPQKMLQVVVTSAEIASVLGAFTPPSLPWLNRDLLLEIR